jgi:NAD(P)H-dependent flavin oxidoreductase YrpB (nitropropane dioxygenase family)
LFPHRPSDETGIACHIDRGLSRSKPEREISHVRFYVFELFRLAFYPACQTIRQRTSRPVNLNFFCHRVPEANHERERRWRELLGRYYIELGLDPSATVPMPPRALRRGDVRRRRRVDPAVVSFHFGLPSKPLQDRVRAAGARIISSATTVEEARWRQGEGCDAVIAQGAEAGGHRGMFLTADIPTQVGTIVVTRLIRDTGPMNPLAPDFPRAAEALAPLRAKAEQNGSGDFSPLWCGQARAICREVPAGELTRTLAAEAAAIMKRLGNSVSDT